MKTTIRLVSLAGALSLAACQQAPTSGDSIETRETPGAPVAPAPAPTSPDAPITQRSNPAQPTGANPTKADPYAGTNDGYPDLSPVSSDARDNGSEPAARAILLPWARGIELREFDQSWALMGDAAKAQISKAKFNAMFAPLHDLFVAIPGGTTEGAAGSSYYTVPTSITGTARDGSKKTISGEVVMRRVNDVPGATPAQLTWHIEQVNLS